MAKEGEKNYLKLIGEDNARNALLKPFSDDFCGRYLMEIGAILTLLPQPPAKLLDLGCGTGWTSQFFGRRGYQVTGQDIAADMIEGAQQTLKDYPGDNIKFIECDYEDLPFENEFDCAVFYDALHHAVDEQLAIKKVYQALKPGGVLITSEPGWFHSKAPASIEAMKKYNVTEKDMNPGKIISAAKKAGFKKWRIYPHATYLNVLLYGKIPDRGLASRLLKFSFVRYLAAMFVIFFYKKGDGLVVLTK